MPPAEWRGDVPALDLLNRMVGEALPLGLRSGPVEPFFQRDVYFDSADCTLRRRGVTCRFRFRVADGRPLPVRTVGRWEGGAPLALPQTFEAEVPELEAASALAGISEPARRLRAVIEPSLLVPRIQFETERRSRRTRPGWIRRARYDVAYDVVTVRSHGLARTFQELKLRQLAPGRPGLDVLAAAFQERYALRPLLVGKVDRAERLLREIESDALASGARGGREVAVIVVEAGCVAGLMDEGPPTLPVRGGSGQEAGPRRPRPPFPGPAPQGQGLGTAPRARTRPPLEVWLGRRAAAPRGAGAGARAPRRPL